MQFRLHLDRKYEGSVCLVQVSALGLRGMFGMLVICISLSGLSACHRLLEEIYVSGRSD